MEKIALITGITGQDGSYLARHLLEQGYRVHGTSRGNEKSPWRHEYLGITDRVTFHSVTLTDRSAVANLITTIQPTEIYHLAAQSSVAESRTSPFETFYTNSLSTLTLLETIRTLNPSIKFFFASSSEIFDQTSVQPLTLASPRLPTSPYGLSKLAGHLLTENYRTEYGLFAVNGVLFPHESPLRQSYSFVKSVVRQAVACTRGEQANVTLEYIDTERDFGDASTYTEIMWESLQADSARDYIIATGKPTSLRAIAEYIVLKLDLSKMILKTKEAPEIPVPKVIYGTSANALVQHQDIYVTIDAMIEFELEHHSVTS